MNGWFYKATSTSPVIIYFGGNAENVANNLEKVSKFEKLGFFLMNYPGFNDAPGKPAEKNVFKNALDTYDQLVNVYKVPPTQIFLMGRSLEELLQPM